MNSIEQQDLYGKSNYEIVMDLGARLRSYRIALRLTQEADIIPAIIVPA